MDSSLTRACQMPAWITSELSSPFLFFFTPLFLFIVERWKVKRLLRWLGPQSEARVQVICIKAAQEDAPPGSLGWGREESGTRGVCHGGLERIQKTQRRTLHHVQRIFPFADAADVSVKTERWKWRDHSFQAVWKLRRGKSQWKERGGKMKNVEHETRQIWLITSKITPCCHLNYGCPL